MNDKVQQPKTSRKALERWLDGLGGEDREREEYKAARNDLLIVKAGGRPYKQRNLHVNQD